MTVVRSYLEILIELKETIDNDECMPKVFKKKALSLTQKLYELLINYSY